MRKSFFALTALFLALTLALAACAGQPASKSGSGSDSGSSTDSKKVAFTPQNTVIVAQPIDDAVTLDPNVSYEFSGVRAVHQVYSNLVTYANGNVASPVPSVAETWDMSGDAKTWRFSLKKGVKFASGNELTADDVVYSFKRAVTIPKNPAAWLITDSMGITEENVDQQVKAVDPYTVEIKLTTELAPGAFLSIMTFPTTGIVDSKVVKEHEENGDFGTKWLADHSAGSGPYVLERWERDAQIVMTYNPTYNLGKEPAIKRVIMKHTAENTAQLQQLNAGDVDLAMSLSAEQLATLKGSDKFYVYQTPDLTLVYVGMDVKNVPGFAKPEVRQAVKYAINYEAITTHLLSGNAIATQGFIPKGMYGAENKTPYTQNIAKAKELMAQAGFANGFTVEMLIGNGTSAGGISTTDLASQVKEDLSKIGITVNLRQLTGSELYTIYRGQKAEMVMAQWGADFADPDNFAKPFGNFPSKSLAWRLQWDDPAIAAKVQKAGTLSNGDERLQLYHDLNEKWMAESPFAILYQPLASLAVSSKVQNVTYNPIWALDFADLTKK